MSKESLKQFLTKLSQDESLQASLNQAPDQESYINLAVQLGEQEGYSFTVEELEEELANFTQTVPNEGELSEQELEAIAGGRRPISVHRCPGTSIYTAC